MLNDRSQQALQQLREGLQQSGEDTRPQRAPLRTDFLKAEVEEYFAPSPEGESIPEEKRQSVTMVRFTFKDNEDRPHIHTLRHLYQAAQSALSELGELVLKVQFGSQVRDQNMPFLADKTHKLVLVDPLAMLHNPIDFLLHHGYLTMMVMSWQVYHAKSFEDAEHATLTDRSGRFQQRRAVRQDRTQVAGRRLTRVLQDGTSNIPSTLPEGDCPAVTPSETAPSDVGSAQ